MSATARDEAAPMAASRRLVLDHAAKLFRTRGYAAVSLRDIASACGIKAGSLYYHFTSREQIVAEVLSTGMDKVFDEARRSADALLPDAPFETRLRAAIGAHLHALLELDDYTGANIRIFSHVPDQVRAAALTQRRSYEDWWRGLLDRGAAEGAFAPSADVRLIRLFLFGAMNWSLEWYRPGGQDVDGIAEQLATTVLHGALAAPPPEGA